MIQECFAKNLGKEIVNLSKEEDNDEKNEDYVGHTGT